MIVYIEETDSMADVTFPSLPHVVSLLHYDDVARSPDNLHPPAGYPVVCVTVSLKGRQSKLKKGNWTCFCALFQLAVPQNHLDE